MAVWAYRLWSTGLHFGGTAQAAYGTGGMLRRPLRHPLLPAEEGCARLWAIHPALTPVPLHPAAVALGEVPGVVASAGDVAEALAALLEAAPSVPAGAAVSAEAAAAVLEAAVSAEAADRTSVV